MNEHMLQQTTVERDLGVIISNDLNWEQHVTSATNKANRKLAMIKHAFSYLEITANYSRLNENDS